jgi:hypothetical protein
VDVIARKRCGVWRDKRTLDTAARNLFHTLAMNFSIESGVPSPYTENTITCITCGKPFAFSQTQEGRCLRDHIAYMENERRQLMAAGRGGGGGQAPIVVQGPTINMSNQQSTSVSAIAQASAYNNGRPRIGCASAAFVAGASASCASCSCWCSREAPTALRCWWRMERAAVVPVVAVAAAVE